MTGHDHRGHSHAPGPLADRRYLAMALGLIVAFMVAEVVAAMVSGSLALFADAGHMLTDVGAIAASIWALGLAQRPHSGAWTFGLKRAEILAAAANGAVLLVVAGLVMLEAVRRLIHPPAVAGGPLLVVALAGVVVNLAATWVLSRADRGSLNIEAAFQHILTDLYAFIGTAVAGGLVITLHWRRADPLASLLVVALLLRASWGLLRASGTVLLEGTPEALDLEDVRRQLQEVPEVLAVHDLHAWTLTSAQPVLSAHVVVTDVCLTDGTAAQVLDHLQDILASRFDVGHSTFQLEPFSHADHEPGTCC